ncbi:ABC transporter ATP-binding protein [Candidatus Marsarchaeota G2 archaeon ECH_B_SAG-G16]|uniref:ABC transporter ATP-binding protein n=1 Tax=Candidatus Marsarchaeota G2 archaeon ECH_B_SAG-G16 TaxID=1978167 RepID=A0A2R6C2M8_9ARCH|nr:MAG: ABC transporter ATP-binding protein [Candidatus Marsarchaeota G2 archaeon ECH_B_SAG-G16]
MSNLLEVKNLRLEFYTRRRVYKVLNDVKLSLKRGEVLGLAGESGSGKSTLGLAIIGLVAENAIIVSGEVLFDGHGNLIKSAIWSDSKFKIKKGRKLIKQLHKQLLHIRGKEMSMVFQDPMSSLNPLLKIGYQIAEVVYYHNPKLLAQRALARSKVTKQEMREIIDLLKTSEESNLVSYLSQKGLDGLYEQIMSIWQRTNLSEVKRERMLLSLANGGISALEKLVLEGVIKERKIFDLPIVRRYKKKILVKEGVRKAVELLSQLGVPHPEKVVEMYPHELSGGMRQRVVIAIALANNPKLVIMDEPTSALDVTIQAQVLELVKRLKNFGSSIIFISHDLSVLAEVADRITIMYAGSIVEVGETEQIINSPKHPYTVALLAAVPTLSDKEIKGIEGETPDLRNPPSGCAFHPRCPFAMEICRLKKPELTVLDGNREVACFLFGGKK